ncbi:MAG: hypothetical protein IKL65_01875 [Bacilli bacterium]|nr:hypothetical protein [Bacilli bacterium]
MREQHYYVCKKGDERQIVLLNYDKLKGFGFSPKNNVQDGIIVNKMVIIKPSMIEKVLRRKIKRKLDLYLKLIIKFIESDDNSSGDTLREALNDLSRYKNIIEYKYKKYLDEKYLKILLKKIALLEYELNSKFINLEQYNYEYEEEKTSHRRR